MKNLGSRIRRIRKLKGYTQYEIADNICSQSELSKIENNQLFPSMSICTAIAKKLDISINELFEGDSTEEYQDEVKKMLELFYQQKFKECLVTLKKLDSRNLIENQQLVLYIKGSCLYYISNKYNEAIELLEESLNITYSDFKINVKPLEIQIINLLGVLYYKKSNSKAIQYFSKSLLLMDKQLYVDIHYMAFSKCYYNIANYYIKENKYLEAERTIQQGIQWCIKNHILYYLIDSYKLLQVIYENNEKKKLLNRTKKIIDTLAIIFNDNTDNYSIGKE